MENNTVTFINVFSIIATLLIALVSLIISLIALKVSRKIYIYSSKDFIPEIEYVISDKDELDIINKSKDLFTIKSLNFLKIITIGFEDYEKKTITQIPFITKSTLWWWIDKSQKIFLKENDAGACAYQICRYDDTSIKTIRERVQSEYSMGSKKGYASPSLQGVKYILEIVYDNNFQERKSVIFMKQHIHSQGYDHSRISETQLRNILDRSNIPKFGDDNELWDYLIKTFSYRY